MGSEEYIKATYRKCAASYNAVAKLFPLIGWRMEHYRVIATNEMNLKGGGIVVDLCCGTGLNFPLIEEKIGKNGKIIGVDLSKDMLREARKSILRNKWKNVRFVNMDASKFKFPKKVDGIITSYAITMVPGYGAVIRKGAKSLTKGGRFVILDFKKPKKWPMWFTKLIVRLFVKPFGGSIEMAKRHPWESLGKCLKLVSMKEFYFGSTYVAVGEK